MSPQAFHGPNPTSPSVQAYVPEQLSRKILEQARQQQDEMDKEAAAEGGDDDDNGMDYGGNVHAASQARRKPTSKLSHDDDEEEEDENLDNVPDDFIGHIEDEILVCCGRVLPFFSLPFGG